MPHADDQVQSNTYTVIPLIITATPALTFNDTPPRHSFLHAQGGQVPTVLHADGQEDFTMNEQRDGSLPAPRPAGYLYSVRVCVCARVRVRVRERVRVRVRVPVRVRVRVRVRVHVRVCVHVCVRVRLRVRVRVCMRVRVYLPAHKKHLSQGKAATLHGSVLCFPVCVV